MALVYQCDCFCDRCGCWSETGTPSKSDAGLGRAALRVAKENGYRRVKRQDGAFEDVCPACIKSDTTAPAPGKEGETS